MVFGGRVMSKSHNSNFTEQNKIVEMLEMCNLLVNKAGRLIKVK